MPGDTLIDRLGMSKGIGYGAKPDQGLPDGPRMGGKETTYDLGNLVGDQYLKNPIMALYVAESAGQDEELRKSAYLVAGLGLEAYLAQIQYSLQQIGGEKKPDLSALQPYLSTVRQLTDYCKGKCGYFGSDKGGAVKAQKAGKASYASAPAAKK